MQRKSLLPYFAGSGLFFLAGVLSAHTWLAAPLANAQTTKQDPKPPQAFLAADERMEPVVREILATMKRMDQRLEHIEKSLTGSKKSAAASTETDVRSRPR